MKRTALALLFLVGCSSTSSEPAETKKTTSDAPRTIAADAGPASENKPVVSASDAGAPSSKTPSPQTAPLARGVAIQEIALYQGTRITLARGGQRVSTRALPVIQGRDALVRVFVAPQPGTPPRSLDAEIFIVSHGQVVSALKDTVVVNRASSETDVTSTFNLMVPGGALVPDSEFVVRLVDASAPQVPTATPSPAQYPTNGTLERFDAQVTGTLKIAVVPIIYGADGSNRPPDVSANVLDAARRRMLEFYPVPDVDIRVRAPVQWNAPILASGTGWDEVLDAVTRLRLQDNAPFDVYYYGAFAPSPSLAAFCGQECLMGLSNFSDTIGDAANRASVGALYADADAIDTMPHEIGHAHGRAHAPCGGASDPDAHYPYANAQLGQWGYSIVTHQLQPPTLFDQMSYCTPAWQSDYTYRGLYDRLHTLATMRVATNGGTNVGGGGASPQSYRMLKVAADGTVSWSGEAFVTASLSETPDESSTQRVSFVDARGNVLAERPAHAYGYDHQRGGIVIVPLDAAPTFARVRIDLKRDIHPAFAPLRRHADYVELSR